MKTLSIRYSYIYIHCSLLLFFIFYFLTVSSSALNTHKSITMSVLLVLSHTNGKEVLRLLCVQYVLDIATRDIVCKNMKMDLNVNVTTKIPIMNNMKDW